MSESAPDLKTHERLRSAIIVCCSFARNLAYYRVGREVPFSSLLAIAHPQASFWRQANSNFLDVAVLEWCKLIADESGRHSYKKIIGDKNGDFRKCLLAELKMTESEYKNYIIKFRSYRDKFVAHLDLDRSMDIPDFDAAKKAIWLYHAYIVKHLIENKDLTELPATTSQMDAGYEFCQREARNIFTLALEGEAQHTALN